MLGILAAWSVYWLFECDPLAVYLLHVLFWFLLDWILLSVVQVNIDECILLWIIDLNLYSSAKDGPLPFSKFEFVLGWFLRELTAPFLFLNALLRPAIRWKAGVYRLKWGGVVEEIKPTVKLWQVFLYYFSAIWFREHVTEWPTGKMENHDCQCVFNKKVLQKVVLHFCIISQ